MKVLKDHVAILAAALYFALAPARGFGQVEDGRRPRPDVTLLAGQPQAFDAATAARILSPLVDDETIAVVHVDVSRATVEPAVALLRRFLPKEAEEISKHGVDVAYVMAALRREGVTDMFLVVSLGGRSMVLRMTLQLQPGEPKRDLAALRAAIHLPAEIGLVAGAAPPPGDRPASRPELIEALKAAGDSPLQVVLIPPASSRRAIEELLPQLPPQIGGGPSTVVTHGISWAASAIDMSPHVAARLTVKSRDAASAEALRAKWLALAKWASEQDTPSGMKIKQALLTPELSGDRLLMTLKEKDLAELLLVMAPGNKRL